MHVSHYEADAFAALGRRAPAHRVRVGARGRVDRAAAAGHRPDRLPRLHPRRAPDGDGLRQLDGDVWQWTASAYLPYPRFAPAAGARR